MSSQELGGEHAREDHALGEQRRSSARSNGFGPLRMEERDIILAIQYAGIAVLTQLPEWAIQIISSAIKSITPCGTVPVWTGSSQSALPDGYAFSADLPVYRGQSSAPRHTLPPTCLRVAAIFRFALRYPGVASAG
jgi:hypothetical protein